MKYVIGLDIGTSAVKGVLLNEAEKVIASAEKGFAYLAPNPGQVVMAAPSYLADCFSVIRTLTKALPESSAISAICPSSASGNLLLLDGSESPLTPIINWRDQRVTTEVSAFFDDGEREDMYETIGWPLGNTFPLAQLCYIKQHTPELLEQAGRIAMSTEYLNYALTGCWGISPSSGTPFYLIDQCAGKYSRAILDRLSITEEQLPPIYPLGTVIGGITHTAAQQTGLSEGTAVVLGCFDHPSAALAAGVVEEGDVLLSAGTSWVLFYPVRNRKTAVSQKLLVDPFLSPEGCWGAMSSLTAISERINFYIEHFIAKGRERFDLLDALAATSQLGAGGLRINLLAQPDEAEITAFGKAHAARAMMEGAAYLLKENLTRLAAGGISAKSLVMVGGPSQSPLWPKVISEILEKEVRIFEGVSSGAIGAAKIALRAMDKKVN